MEHTKSKVVVYMSDDYRPFKFVEGNRGLNKKKIERIIREIKTGNDILDEVPILVNQVNGHFEVLDGQHRLEICKQLKRPVHFIIHKTKMNLYNVAKVNSNVEKWKDADFIKCYMKAGNDNYKKLDQFLKKYHIAVGISLILLTDGKIKNDGGSYQEAIRTNFEQGTFEIKKWKDAIQLAEICMSFSAFKAWNTRHFIIAMCRILEADKCEMNILLKKFTEDPSALQNHSNWRSTLTNLEEIYNKGFSKRRVIF